MNQETKLLFICSPDPGTSPVHTFDTSKGTRKEAHTVFAVLQIEDGKITNASILLQIDNANMASEDFRLK